MAATVPSPPEPKADGPRRWTLRFGKKLRRPLDRIIARHSLVPNDPVLPSAAFPWTAALRENWLAIRDEATEVLHRPQGVPLLGEVSPDHRRIGSAGTWRSFFLVAYGAPLPDNLARCPRTAAVIAGLPRLNSAFFSILAPHAHIPRHRGVTKGLLTCHLGLIVPPGPIRMQVGPETVGWAEGETLVFDDTYKHEVWNETGETRVVLFTQFDRPVAGFGRVVATAFLWGVRRSSFVREGVRNIAAWETTRRQAPGAER